MAFVFSITNQKGGVGKTTTSISLAHFMAKMGQKVLLIDADPQYNATSGLNIENNKSFYDFLCSNDSQIPLQRTKWENLFIIAADPRLSGLDIEWADRKDRSFILKNKMRLLTPHFDYIFIDSPPSLGVLTVNALVASKYFIIPLQCEYYALEGLSLLLETATSIKENFNPDLKLIGILMTMFDSRNTLSHQVAKQVTKYFKNRVFRTVIPRNVRLSEAPSHGLPILEYDPRCVGAKAYEALARELYSKMKKISKTKLQELTV